MIPGAEYELTASTTTGHGSDHGIARRPDRFAGDDWLMPGHPAALPPRVAVTGSQGKLGRAVVGHLRTIGVDVLAIDRAGGDPREVAGEFLLVDLTDYGQVVEALTGGVDEHQPVEAVVHLAAIPAPGLTSNAVTYANNSASTYNVFAACRAAGITTIVWASSETVLGLPFHDPPPYAPVDEGYPPRPESTYALNKTLEEELARQFCRWQPNLIAVGLRFSNVMDVADYAEFPSFDADAHLRKWNLWGYIDARDGAHAVERALTYDVPGADVFIIANADTVMTRSSPDLMAQVYPHVRLTKTLGEHETLLSIDKARRLLGYQPIHSWRAHVQSPV